MRVIIVDDDKLVAMSLRTIVAGCAADGYTYGGNDRA